MREPSANGHAATLTGMPVKVKRKRRTKEQMKRFREAVGRVVTNNDPPMTVRHAFYLASNGGLVEKTEAGYDAVGDAILWLRRNACLDWGHIKDSNRQRHKAKTYSSVEFALEETARLYRRSLWHDQAVHVEIWTEKDTLTGLLWPLASRWDVPLMVSRGFTSDSYLHEAAEDLRSVGKPCYLYYVGDFDPSGVIIDRVIERKLRTFAPGVEIHFQRVAVTPAQIADMNLVTRPTKRIGKSGKPNSHAKSFKSERSVEVEAIRPAVLRQLVSGCIDQHVDRRQMQVLLAAERSEKEALQFLAFKARNGLVEGIGKYDDDEEGGDE